MAEWTRSHVVRAVQEYFPDENQTGILGILEAYGQERIGVDATEAARTRVQVAILEMSRGDVDRLISYTARAIRDFRDVLLESRMPIMPADDNE